jgi:hypothetical protein
MSVPVEPAALASAADGLGAPYVITTGADGRAHVSAQVVDIDGATVRCSPGRSSLRNGGGGGPVVLLWPQDAEGFSLIADGTGLEEPDGVLAVAVTRAVLHRPAEPA